MMQNKLFESFSNINNTIDKVRDSIYKGGMKQIDIVAASQGILLLIIGSILVDQNEIVLIYY